MVSEEHIKKEIWNLKLQILEIEKQKNAVISEYNEKMRPFEEKLQEMRKKLDAELSKLNGVEDNLRNKTKELEKQLYDIEKDRKYREYIEKGIPSTEAFQKILDTDRWIDTNVRGGKLKNGIIIVKLGENRYKPYSPESEDMMYLAFYKDKLIGFWGRRRALHRGDETIPVGVITTNREIPKDRNNRPESIKINIETGEIEGEKWMDFRIEPKSKPYYYFSPIRNIVFNEWKAILKRMTPEHLEIAEGIDITDEKNREILFNWWWMG